jgi:nanoRNase/pAp phosphatase (c-di-AMP/oligoRNAs hydrolase)
MTGRLLLGCGPVGRRVASRLHADGSELRVLCPDAGAVEALRSDSVPAEAVDPADRAVLSAHDPAVVFAAGATAAETAAFAEAAAAELPDAHLVAYVGPGEDDADVAAVADEVVDAGAALAEHVLDVAESADAVRGRRLRSALTDVEGELAVVMHDNPDPDAIGAALALAAIAEAAGVPATPCYFGEINHEENRALVNLLELDLLELEDGADLSRFGGFALVDHSRPGVNDGLPTDTPVDVVVDHHPPRGPVEARFADLRREVGATSTLLVAYLDALGYPPDATVATALLYGIRVDTDDFSREASTADFEAAASLLPRADLSVLDRVENPSLSPETLDTLGRAIREREIRGGGLVSYVGEVTDRDALAQAADTLLGMTGVDTTLVVGRMGEVAYVSARGRGADVDLGETLRMAYGQIGSAGGHADMAGAQVPLRSLTGLPDDSDLPPDDVVADVLGERFYETMRDGAPSVPPRGQVEAVDNVVHEPDEDWSNDG